eukprot:15073335-Alexandrium_andersonii.AAC.1
MRADVRLRPPEDSAWPHFAYFALAVALVHTGADVAEAALTADAGFPQVGRGPGAAGCQLEARARWPNAFPPKGGGLAAA